MIVTGAGFAASGAAWLAVGSGKDFDEDARGFPMGVDGHGMIDEALDWVDSIE